MVDFSTNQTQGKSKLHMKSMKRIRQMVEWEEEECEMVEATNGFSAPGNNSRLSKENRYVIFILDILSSIAGAAV